MAKATRLRGPFKVTTVLVYATASRAQTVRSLLGAACKATGLDVRLELYGTGSLYQRLGPRHAPPLPDLVMWSGAFAAQSAALDGLLQAHQPARVADAAAHDPNWRWTTLDYTSIGVVDSPGGGTGSTLPGGAGGSAAGGAGGSAAGGAGGAWIGGLQGLAGVPGLAIADPERSEAGLSILLATLDRARQVDGDVERGWLWWQQRVASGVALAEDDAGAVALVGGTDASHAISLVDTATPVAGLAPLPNAVGVAASARNVEAAGALLDWLVGEDAAAGMRLSPWQASTNGLQARLAAAPPLDIEWCRQQYTPTRRRWAQSGWSPRLTQAPGQG